MTITNLGKRIGRKLFEAGVFWLGMMGPVLAQAPATTDTQVDEGASAAQPTGAESNLFEGDGIFRRIINTIIFLIGAISVVMLIVGGVRYVVSAGNDEAVKGAKNTILYAIIGLIIALIAYAAINFVIGQLSA